jgi:hypothetical protein
LLAILLLLTVIVWLPDECAAGGDTPGDAMFGALAGRFSSDLRVLTYGVVQEYADSTQNASNNFLQIPRYIANVEIRPDLSLDLDPLTLSAKPRARLYYRAWTEGCRRGDSEWDSDLFVNEWLARWGIRQDLFLSYGRENLQWGPSFLFSPSNPFFRDNGRRNPYLEVPGMGFGRAVWLPNSSFTASFIVNTNEGLNAATGPGRFLSPFIPMPFERTYSLKMDYTGQENYGSLILSRREDSENILGFFGGWTVSDAVLLYGEGSLTQGSPALYPAADSSRFAVSMRNLHKHDTALTPAILAGGSYTFETKGTMTLEYAYYGPGLNDEEAGMYYSLRRRASQAVMSGGPLSAAGQAVLGQMATTGLRLLRRNYALIQYTHNHIRDVVDLTLRWTQNLDDGSGQFTAVLVCYLGKHVELFSVASIMTGGKDTEYGSMLDRQWMAGLKYTF